ITEADSDKVAAISRQPRVNVSYASDKGWVSLSGTASLNQDRAKLEELWDPSASAFMQGGPDDPNSALLEVSGDTAQLWESPGKLGMLVQVAKGALGKEDPAKDSDAPVVDL
ncbi:MAG: pyridoxamine 5'-phosphate oxidase family protein, partial [Tetrasphaera sp.]|nr:pyridoxamine 5'-phosphate oxidase family protein [Tetrasphaera sp.]